MLVIKLGKGNVSFEGPVTVSNVIGYLKANPEKARELGVQGQLNDTIVADYNGSLIDLSSIISVEGDLKLLGPGSEEGLDTLRHSASHIMAQAALRLYPGSKLGIGPTIQEGFYYDIETSSPINEEDLARIEDEMEKIAAENFQFSRQEMGKDKAVELFKKAGQPYKVEIIKDIASDEVSLYSQGEYTDLCRGPHIPSTKHLKAFKLLSVSGAYWRGSEKNAMLTRIYGTAFADRKSLDAHLAMLGEARKRDHRKVGKELGLFSFHEEGPGLPFWKHKGLILKNLLIDYMREKQNALGYIEVETPTILRDILWKTSGHLGNFKENMFFTEREEEVFALKPMNCPGGILIYKEDLHSYKELPLKIAEFGKVHRFERSGVLQGLFRVRGFTQDDAHIFTTPDKLKASIIEIIKLVDAVYKDFGFEYTVGLSTRPEQSMGTDEEWDNAVSGLKNALDETAMSYTIHEGEGAFYGPKIEYNLKDAIGRTHQCGTIQLDMNNPEMFDINFIAEDGREHRAIMLHRAILGSLERFIGILIEHYGGKFPLWLSPVQAAILPVSDKFNEYASSVEAILRSGKVRMESDLSSEKLGYKIRKAQMGQVPYMLIVGEKEVETKTVSVRHRERGDLGSSKPEEILKIILEENANRM
ncbi:MAG: threonine--tRNA ligase [Brevinematales bacterium]|jgi:threonyl-tRNA synthetase